LAVAKVLTGSGTVSSIVPAIRWAVHVVHADVINMSIGDIAPVPAALDDVFDALDDARHSGVLVVVGNGNGWANLGLLPGEPGWATAYSASTSVLAVGASDVQGLTETSDPQVTVDENVHTAGIGGDRDYVDAGGTSFASPQIAGFAGRLIAAARDSHRVAGPTHIQKLIEYSAEDTVRPPQAEGYGALTLARLPAALAYARRGSLPARPSPDWNGWYVENVAGRLRDIWSNRLRNP
jgi:subtilisin family serine protease